RRRASDCLLPAWRACPRVRAAPRGRAQGRRPRDDARDCRRQRRGSRGIRAARPPARQRQYAGGLCPDRIVAMMLPVYALVRSRIQSGLERAFGLAPQDQPPIVLEVPPRRALGDLAAPVAFELARRLRKAPKVLAQELQTALGRVDGVARIEAAPNGYVNFFLDRAAFIRAHVNQAAADTALESSDKVIVEHTAINPN